MTDFIVEDSADPLERKEYRPLIRAKWILKKGFNVRPYECSECHTASECRSNYCQQCGAYMMSREAAG